VGKRNRQKAREARVQVSREDLEHQLRDHYDFLTRSGQAFDNGYAGEAKRLATSLRVLVHQGQGQPLLRLLGVQKKITYLDTAGGLTPGNLLPENGLTALKMGPGTAVAEAAALDRAEHRNEVSFSTWWSVAVAKDSKRVEWNRRDLVLALANQDGGAHVDPSLTEAYAALSRNNSMGMTYTSSDDPEPRPMPSPVPASVRQVAYEMTLTLERHLWRELNISEPPTEAASA
jgi:hypothetical protein